MRLFPFSLKPPVSTTAVDQQHLTPDQHQAATRDNRAFVAEVDDRVDRVDDRLCGMERQAALMRQQQGGFRRSYGSRPLELAVKNDFLQLHCFQSFRRHIYRQRARSWTWTSDLLFCRQLAKRRVFLLLFFVLHWVERIFVLERSWIR